MRLSVIIITYNRARSLDRALASFLAVDRPRAVEIELVVVDNNSTDDTRRVVEHHARMAPFPLRRVPESRQGSNFARNRGIEASHGEWLAFIDDDMAFHPRWLPGVELAVSRCHQASLIAGRVIPVFDGHAGSPPPWMRPTLLVYYGHQDHGPDPIPIEPPASPWEMNLLVPRWVFDACGVFGTAVQRTGTTLLSNDGVHFVRRVRAAGGICMFDPAPQTYHHIPAERTTPRWLYARSFWQGVSDIRSDPDLAMSSAAGLLEQAWNNAREVWRVRTGGNISPRRVRWHATTLSVEHRCHAAYMLGMAWERVRTVMRRTGRGIG